MAKALPVLALLCAARLPSACAADSSRLAVRLAAEGDHEGAVIEFRRMALAASSPSARGGYHWAAAHEYWKAGDHGLADKMLNRAEDEAPDLSLPALVLRGESASASRAWEEADFYFSSVLNGRAGDDERAYAAARLAAVRMRRADASGARAALAESPANAEAALAAVDTYVAGRDRNPKVGGVLGLIPGFGYFYAGEFANGLRSIILNGLFIFGMADTANEEQWGAFAVITFFEFTWYSGSIYGGVDASHRYNRRRLDDCVATISGSSRFEPDYAQLPVVSLRFSF